MQVSENVPVRHSSHSLYNGIKSAMHVQELTAAFSAILYSCNRALLVRRKWRLWSSLPRLLQRSIKPDASAFAKLRCETSAPAL